MIQGYHGDKKEKITTKRGKRITKNILEKPSTITKKNKNHGYKSLNTHTHGPGSEGGLHTKILHGYAVFVAGKAR